MKSVHGSAIHFYHFCSLITDPSASLGSLLGLGSSRCSLSVHPVRCGYARPVVLFPHGQCRASRCYVPRRESRPPAEGLHILLHFQPRKA